VQSGQRRRLQERAAANQRELANDDSRGRHFSV
jgi:hypothetical protein